MSLRVLIVDDQVLVRTGFRMILEAEEDIEVVGEAGDGIEAIAPPPVTPLVDGVAESVAIYRDLARDGRLDPAAHGLEAVATT